MLAQRKTADTHYTPQEYLRLEKQAVTRSEYHQGQIVAMAGATVTHNRINVNLTIELGNLLRDKPCDLFANDIRVQLPREDRYVYPDLVIVCGEPEFDEDDPDTLINPQVIIEVLSNSTANYDRGDKFHAYWTLDSFAEYVLVDQYKMRVEYFRRANEKLWELRVLTKPDDLLELKSLDVVLPLSSIYRRVHIKTE
ncbi:Uma2 family endonuclease [Anaerolineales bacterium HSG25]|nr:Uma2 family endonuclease [Anaerolineales bacterium HSG25]